MAAKLLLFGFEDLPSILRVETAAESCGAAVVPVGRRDYNTPLGILAGLDTERSGGPGRCGNRVPEGGADSPQPQLGRCAALQ